MISVTTAERTCILSRFIYSDVQIKEAWNKKGQGHNEAVGRGSMCVVKKCSEEEALAMSRVFIDRFAIPTCCNYNGETLSMYCGSAGGGYNDLKQYCEQMRIG